MSCRFSAGIRSEFWLGHCRTQIGSKAFSCGSVLSNYQLTGEFRPSFMSAAAFNMFSSRNVLHLAPSRLTLTSFCSCWQNTNPSHLKAISWTGLFSDISAKWELNEDAWHTFQIDILRVFWKQFTKSFYFTAMYNFVMFFNKKYS